MDLGVPVVNCGLVRSVVLDFQLQKVVCSFHVLVVLLQLVLGDVGLAGFEVFDRVADHERRVLRFWGRLGIGDGDRHVSTHHLVFVIAACPLR